MATEKLSEKIRKMVLKEIKDYVDKQGKIIFFKNDVKLSDGSNVVSVTTNSSNCVLTTKKANDLYRTRILASEPLSIIEEISFLIDNKYNKISAYTWWAESEGEDYYETCAYPYSDDYTAYCAMLKEAMGFNEINSQNVVDDIFNGYKEVSCIISKDKIKVDWLTYKLIYVKE